jgi:hypothetical protein
MGAYLSVPKPTPFFEIFETSFARHDLPAAAAFVRLVFSMHEAAALERLLLGAGFSAIDVQSHTTRLRLPPPPQFFWQYIQGTPLAATMAQVDDQTRSAVAREVSANGSPGLTVAVWRQHRRSWLRQHASKSVARMRLARTGEGMLPRRCFF